ncbi:MAG: type II secretion system protein [Patescibacteria group bacterium]|nr:type II secretion system protein [Patescibacteria group bacterium]MDE2172384.1 type II secretion system protein [Patescibacteria group bacterium]
MKTTIRSRSGFTLIELLMVIVIIALLTSVILSSLANSKGKARDGKRISDISQIQLSLEQYFDRCNVYPPTIDPSNSLYTDPNQCSANPGILMSSFISTMPTPPSGSSLAQSQYDYAYNSTRTDYALHAVLENTNDAVKDGLPSNTYPLSGWTSALGNTFTCNNAAGSTDYCVGPK